MLGIVGCDVPGVLEIKNGFNEEIELSYSNQGQMKIDSRNSGKIQANDKGILLLGFGSR